MGHNSSWKFALARPYVLWEVGVALELLKQCSTNCDSRKPQRRQLPRLVKFAMTTPVAGGVWHDMWQMIVRSLSRWSYREREEEGNGEGM